MDLQHDQTDPNTKTPKDTILQTSALRCLLYLCIFTLVVFSNNTPLLYLGQSQRLHARQHEHIASDHAHSTNTEIANFQDAISRLEGWKNQEKPKPIYNKTYGKGARTQEPSQENEVHACSALFNLQPPTFTKNIVIARPPPSSLPHRRPPSRVLSQWRKSSKSSRVFRCQVSTAVVARVFCASKCMEKHVRPRGR